MIDGSGFIKFTQDSDLSVLEAPDLSNLNQSSNNFFTGNTTSVQLSDGLAQNSNSVIFYQGQTFFGNTYGVVDPGGKNVSGTTSGTSSQSEDLTASLAEFAESEDAILNFPDIVDSFNMNFEGKVTRVNPQTRFEATGQIEFFTRPPISAEIIVGDLPPVLIGGVGGAGGTTNNIDFEDLITKVVTTDGSYNSQGIVDVRIFGRRTSITPTNGNPLDISQITGG